MAKQDQNMQIDEDFMKEIISQGLPSKSITSTPKETVSQKETQVENKSSKKKKNTNEDYQEMFFKRIDIVNRQPLYVSRVTHEKLLKIVTVIGGHKATISSYVENILQKHFETYQDEINERYKNQFENPL